MPRYADLDTKYATLSEDFGLNWATKLFGVEAITSLPTYQRGPKAGKPKAYVIWRKAATAGWCRESSEPVAIGQLVDAWIAPGPFARRSDALSGQWCGRVETLALSRTFLFEEGRQRKLQDDAKARAAIYGEDD